MKKHKDFKQKIPKPNKVERVYIDLIKHLPERYKIPIKCFKTIRGILMSVARRKRTTYKNRVNYYTKYLNNTEKATYIDTKYYRTIKKEKYTAFDIAMMGSSSILVSLENTLYLTKNKIKFLFLHEIAHNVLDTLDERKCDLFAIRWIRKLNKITGGE